jgi:hypothetical protein
MIKHMIKYRMFNNIDIMNGQFERDMFDSESKLRMC